MRDKILPFIAAALLVGSASIVSAQQTAPAGPKEVIPEQEQENQGPRRPGQAANPAQPQMRDGGGQVEGQTPAPTTGASGPAQGSQDKGAAGFQNEPDHSKSKADQPKQPARDGFHHIAETARYR